MVCVGSRISPLIANSLYVIRDFALGAGDCRKEECDERTEGERI